MITLRKATDRGHADHGWLDSWHSFSFASYHDPAHMGVGNLRVINEDRIAPGTGFGTHGHRDMEIVSYVLDGALAHQDSMGNGQAGADTSGKAAGVIRPGDVQRMSAGTGVLHSEFNHSKDSATHFLQIWIIPERKGLKPSYEQKTFGLPDKANKLRLIGSRNGREGSVTIHQDVDLYATVLEHGESVTHSLATNRLAWIQVARGSVKLNGEVLQAGDGAAIESAGELRLEGEKTTEVLLFDMAP